jgi:hypothetical protein
MMAMAMAYIGLACRISQVSRTCFRFQPKRDADNELSGDWLLKLTGNQRAWGFGLCAFLTCVTPRVTLVSFEEINLFFSMIGITLFIKYLWFRSDKANRMRKPMLKYAR